MKERSVKIRKDGILNVHELKKKKGHIEMEDLLEYREWDYSVEKTMKFRLKMTERDWAQLQILLDDHIKPYITNRGHIKKNILSQFIGSCLKAFIEQEEKIWDFFVNSAVPYYMEGGKNSMARKTRKQRKKAEKHGKRFEVEPLEYEDIYDFLEKTESEEDELF